MSILFERKECRASYIGGGDDGVCDDGEEILRLTNCKTISVPTGVVNLGIGIVPGC